MSQSSDKVTKFWLRNRTACFVAAALVLIWFTVGSFRSESHSISRSFSWQWTGWDSLRFHAYDPCVTPEGKPSGAKVYQVGPITFVTLTLRLPKGGNDLLLTGPASSTEPDAKEAASSNTDQELFPMLPPSKGDVLDPL